MNIYVLRMYRDVGWDEYDSHVVLADTEKEARTMCPNGDEGSDTWLDVTKSSCVKIGVADKSQEKCVILSSFNAG